MKVILTEDIPKLGKTGDTVEVAEGYGRNYLVPQGKAFLASTKNIKALGEYKVSVRFHSEVEAELNVQVVEEA